MKLINQVNTINTHMKTAIGEKFHGVLSGSMPSYLLAFCTFGFLSLFARLDFDVHHDGLLMTGAIAQRAGFTVHREYYAQYGPVLPWVQSLVPYFTDSIAVGIRFLNVLFISLTVFALCEMGRLRSKALPISRSSGVLAAVIWVSISDVFGWVPMLPWSSVIATCFTVWLLLSVIRSIHFYNINNLRRSRNWAIMSGTISGLLPFTRINVGVGSVLVITFLALSLVIVSSNTRKLAVYCLGSMLGVVFLTLLVLSKQGALQDWWRQAIAEPWNSQENMKETYNPLKVFGQSLRIYSPLFLATLICVGIGIYTKSLLANQKTKNLFLLSILISATLSTFICLFFFVLRNKNVVINGSLSKQNTYQDENLKVFSYLAFLSWSGILASVVLPLITISISIFRKIESEILFWCLLLCGLAFAGMTQVWPVPDTRHYWWGVPLSLLVLTSAWEYLFPLIKKCNSMIVHPMVVPTVLSLLISLPSARAYLRVDRLPAPVGTPVEGMLLSTDYWGRSTALLIESDLKLLSRHINKDSKILYITSDGHYASMTGKFNSVDEKYVSWPSLGDLMMRAKSAQFIVIDKSQAATITQILSQPNSFYFRGQNERLQIYQSYEKTQSP